MKSPATSLFVVFLALLLSVPAFSQENNNDYITLEGSVRDKDSRRKLEFVHVTVPGTSIGTVTNNDGEFMLKVKKTDNVNKIMFSHIGYKNTPFVVDTVNMSDINIYLTPASKNLSEVIIRGGDARLIVEEALQLVRNNYAQTSTLQTGFYRETAQKRKRYINISEAVINTYKTSYSNNNILRDRVRVLKGRKLLSPKTSDTLAVKLLGGPTLPVFLDIVKNPDLLLDPEILPYYKFDIKEIAWLNERPHFVIAFRPQVELPFALYKGLLYIDQEKMSFSRAEFSLDMEDILKATQAILHKKPFGLRFKPVEVSFLVTYQENNGFLHLNYVRNVIRFKCDWKRRLFSTTYTIVSEMVATDNMVANEGISYKDSFKKSHSLSDEVDNFEDDDFWGDYNIIEPTESLENAVEKLRKLNLKNLEKQK